MAQNTLVENSIGIGRQFVRAFDQCVPVELAFWYADEEDQPLLYIHTKRVSSGNRDVAIGEILRVASAVGLDPFQVRLVDWSDSILRNAMTALKEHESSLPIRLVGKSFAGFSINDFYFYKVPGDLTMPATGVDALHAIIDEEAAFFEREGKYPIKMRLPVLMAYDLAKCGRDVLGEMSGRIFKDGINVLEREGFHGMKVEIVRNRDAVLEFE